MTTGDYAYWAGRLSVALRCVLDHPDDLGLKLTALNTLSAYEALKPDDGIGADVVEMRAAEAPYPEGPLASRRVDQ